MTIYTPLAVYRIGADGRIEKHASETPAVINTEPVRVSIRKDTDRALACRLLRRLADEMEAQQ